MVVGWCVSTVLSKGQERVCQRASKGSRESKGGGRQCKPGCSGDDRVSETPTGQTHTHTHTPNHTCQAPHSHGHLCYYCRDPSNTPPPKHTHLDAEALGQIEEQAVHGRPCCCCQCNKVCALAHIQIAPVVWWRWWWWWLYRVTGWCCSRGERAHNTAFEGETSIAKKTHWREGVTHHSTTHHTPHHLRHHLAMNMNTPHKHTHAVSLHTHTRTRQLHSLTYTHLPTYPTQHCVQPPVQIVPR